MSNEIVSQLGFDASKAISELKKLDSAMKAVDKTTGSLAAGFQVFNSKSGQLPATLANLAAQAKALGGALGSVPGAASAAATNLKKLTSVNAGQSVQQVERLTTSLGLLSRIVFTQAVIKGLRLTEDAIASAGKSAADFQLQLAEIGTIANGSLGSLENIGKAVRGVSDSFNIPLATAGKPRYFAAGGPVGPDRIPAWLSRGESVNTSQATSRFYSQISAMNAGHAPTAATRVGDTNVNLNGDFNINGAQSPAQTADAIVSTVRRSFRRGTSRPF